MGEIIKKKILVTGGSGFIGTNFIRHALTVRPDWHIVNLDVLTYAGNPANFNDLTTEFSESLHFRANFCRKMRMLKNPSTVSDS